MILSNMKDIKIAIDTMFNTNWIATPIHWSGIEFNSDGVEKWINVVYEPNINKSTALSGSSTMITGSIYVVCWADYQFDAMDLADSVVSMVTNNLPENMVSTDSSVIDQGFNPNNKAFIVLHFPIKVFLCN